LIAGTRGGGVSREHARAFNVTGENIQVHIGKWICGLVAAAGTVAPAIAASLPPSVLVSLDARDYVAYTATSFTPSTGVLSVTGTAIENCRRAEGGMPVSGPLKLHRSADTLDIDFATMRIDFHPTRLVLESSTHDVVCDGQALGWQTGVGRIFGNDFDA